MEERENPVNALLEGAEAYTKTTFNLLKLRAASKASDVFTMVIYHFFVVVIFSFVLFGISAAVALWLGELLGKIFLGFIWVGVFYGLVGAILVFVRPGIKTVIYNSVLGNILHKTPKPE